MIQSKLPDIGTSIFAIMSKMAHECGAINLSQGYPDFAVSEELISNISAAMEEGYNQYAPMPGHPALCQGIAGMVRSSYDRVVDPVTQITTTSGATEGIYASLTAIVNDGDEVILFSPAYDSYEPSILLSKGVPVYIPLTYPEFSIDWDKVRDAITDKTRVIMINTPHNPSGAVLSSEDIAQLEQIVTEHNILVVSDEVYEHIIFDGTKHQSILGSDILSENGVAIFSFGKTFHATGWKIGYTIAPEWLTEEIRKVHQFITFSVNHPVQKGLADFTRDPENYSKLPVFYQKKRDHFIDLIKDSRFTPIPCHGTYFQLLGYENISEKDDMAMAEELTCQHKVAAIPISVFYPDRTDNRLLRFCFAKKDETLEKAAEILCRI